MRASFALFILFSIFPFNTFAGAFISDEMRYEIINEYVEAKAGRLSTIDLGSPGTGALFQIQAQVLNEVYNDINIYVCAKNDLQMFLDRRENDCRGLNRKRGNMDFVIQTKNASKHYLVIDNSFSLLVKKKVNVQVTLEKTMSRKMKQQIEDVFSYENQEILKSFNISSFDFTLEPCGTKNAYSNTSSGDIIICSELFWDLTDRNMSGAIYGLLYHELGHTLLNLWGLPGWDNEETVDEFAIVMLYWKGYQEKAIDWINFYAAQDSKAEARNSVRYDTKHPLSIQRTRNAKRILNSPRDVIARWNKLLYPHMTEYGFRKLIRTSPLYADIDLIKKYVGN